MVIFRRSNVMLNCKFIDILFTLYDVAMKSVLYDGANPRRQTIVHLLQRSRGPLVGLLLSNAECLPVGTGDPSQTWRSLNLFVPCL
jgi:hypothetical protein